MKHPPYHLRLQKAVDRFLLIEILKKLQKKIDFSGYNYYGFGGPFLEDLRLMNLYFPEIKLISFEKDEETHKRQKFHKFARNLRLMHSEFKEFIVSYVGGQKEIFWLDYPGLRYDNIDEFTTVLQKAGENSVVKISLRADLGDWLPKKSSDEKADEKALEEAEEKFRSEFGKVLPSNDIKEYLTRKKKFVSLVCQMIRIASEQTLPLSGGLVFKLLNASHYAEPTPMLSITGIKCEPKKTDVNKLFRACDFINLDWEKPHYILVPNLSIKERLHLEKYLPQKSDAGKRLSKILGYHIADDKKTTIEQLNQYAAFHRYFPQFAKVSF